MSTPVAFQLATADVATVQSLLAGTNRRRALEAAPAARATSRARPRTERGIGAAGVKKSHLKPWQRRQWWIGQVDGADLAAMEDGLDLYAQPNVVRLCFDERPCQLFGDVDAPLPLAPAQARRVDYEYARNGTACVLLAYDLDTGQCYGLGRAQRTKADYAHFFDGLLATHYAHATRIELVQNNLPPPTLTAL